MNEAFEKAVVEHLWPAALTGGKISIYQCAEIMFRAGMLAAQPEKAECQKVPEGNEIDLNIIRKWPEGFQGRLQHVWLDVVSFIPNVKLHDLQCVLAEYGFTMRIYETTLSAAPKPEKARPECECGAVATVHCPACSPEPIERKHEIMPTIAEPVAQEPTLHPDTESLVQRFAAAMREKLAKAEKKYGYSNLWKNQDWMNECRAKLIDHLHKGDPLDVANYCAFLWHHGAHCKPVVEQEAKPAAWVYTINKSHSVFSAEKPPEDAYDEGTLFPLYDAPPTEAAIRADEREKMLAELRLLADAEGRVHLWEVE